MPKLPKIPSRIRLFSLILVIFDLFWTKNVQNEKKYIKINHISSHRLHRCAKVQITPSNSKQVEIGTFQPFLATFGVESVTRWMKIFFKHPISVKTINKSELWWYTNQKDLISLAEMGKFLFFENWEVKVAPC